MEIEKQDNEQLEKLKYHYGEILKLLGEDTEREGLIKTPERVAKAVQFMTQGYEMDAREVLLSAKFREDYRQMVIVKNIEFYSTCEHHMASFFRKSTCGLYSQQIYYRTEQAGSRGRYLCPPPSSTGAYDHSNQRVHSANTQSAGCDGCN